MFCNVEIMKKSTRKYTWIAIGSMFGLALIIWGVTADNSSSASSSSSSVGSLTVMENDYDFGTISMEDGDVIHQFELMNDSSESVTINEVYTSCMCTTATITDAKDKTYGEFGMSGHGLLKKTNITLAPGDSAMVAAVFDPAAHGPSGVGLADRTVYIETNSTDTPTIELDFKAMVTR